MHALCSVWLLAEEGHTEPQSLPPTIRLGRRKPPGPEMLTIQLHLS